MSAPDPAAEPRAGARESLRSEAWVWLRIGCLSFGGPAGQIALMQRMLVDELRWITPRRFLTGLDLCMLLPGPEAQQLATFVGWTRHGWRGGVVAGGLFVLPGALLMLALSASYVLWGTLPAVAALFGGVQCAVVVIVAEALVRIGRRAIGSPGALAIAILAFAALALFGVPFPLVVIGAAAVGILIGSREPVREREAPAHTAGTTGRRAALPALVAAGVWLLPLVALFAILGPEALPVRIALQFGELAIVSFGGAYALLAAIAERAVADGWLTAPQMADGLALAETTPGPLILVLQFVAFVTAHGATPTARLAAGLFASAIALWALFPPSFVWIFLAAPHLDRVDRSPVLRRAVRGVTAAVVGVIFHLTLWFALHVLFERLERLRWGSISMQVPALASVDWAAAAITVVCALLLFLGRQSIARTLLVAALLGGCRAIL